MAKFKSLKLPALSPKGKAESGKSVFNPFLNKKGGLLNKFLNYQAVLDDPEVSQRAKAFIHQATGLTPAGMAGKSGAAARKLTDMGIPRYTPSSFKRIFEKSGNALVDTAKKYLGTPYVWGGASPKGFDCSGLMQYTFSQNGISIPRTAREQFKAGSRVSAEDLRPGDLVFFKGSGGSVDSPGHVGMYVGDGQYIQAPKSGDVVKISNLSGRKDYVGARRYGEK